MLVLWRSVDAREDAFGFDESCSDSFRERVDLDDLALRVDTRAGFVEGSRWLDGALELVPRLDVSYVCVVTRDPSLGRRPILPPSKAISIPATKLGCSSGSCTLSSSLLSPSNPSNQCFAPAFGRLIFILTYGASCREEGTLDGFDLSELIDVAG